MKRFVIFLLVALPLWAKGGAFKSTKHADSVNGPQRRAEFPAGSCVQCHDGHDRRGDSNALCLECHGTPSESGIFPGAGEWQLSAHVSGTCADCHDPHGVKDSDGVIPGLLRARQEKVCIGCHDGGRGANIRDELLEAYVHGKRGQPVACSECHNPHRDALWGITRVEVTNGPAGTQPNITLKPASDPSPAQEFEVCFKCHATLLGRLTNPENPSFHPIQGEGRNRRIDPESFVTGWSADSTVRCSDCHATHGSQHAALLKKRVPLSAEIQTMTRTDLCFDCHSYRVYADPAADPEVRRATRFDAHSIHVAGQRVPCYSCHETHGSTRHPYLIAIRRSGGIANYVPTLSGGTCTSTCHTIKTYSVNYPR